MRKKRTNLGGTIEKTNNKKTPYRVRVIVGYNEKGYAQRKTLGNFRTKAEAEMALVKFNTNPVAEDLINITVAEVYQRWSEVAFQKLSENTKRKYTNTFNKHLAPVHKFKMRDIKVQHILALMNGKSRSLQHDIKVMCGSLCKWAQKREIIDRNYGHLVEIGEAKLVKSNSRERRVFAHEEIQYLWDNVDNIRFADLTLILLYTGMRISELLELETKNIFLDQDFMIGGIKKYDEEGNLITRVIPIHPDIKPLIERRLGNDFLFYGENNAVLEYNNYHKSYMKESMIGHLPHDTRHTFITRMRELFANDMLLKTIVGHSDKSMTTHYTHIKPEQLIAEIRRLNYL